MVRNWFVTALTVAMVAVGAGCSSNSGSSALPKLTRKDWTRAGLAEVNAAAAAITRAEPGQCANGAPNDFAQFPISMKALHSRVVPTGQLLCDVDGETVEITAFASVRDRDRYLDDRSTGICARAKAQAVEHKQPNIFAGLRWAVGAGNLTLQPDSQGLAQRLSAITAGRYVARPCSDALTMDWDPKAVTALNALGRKIAASGRGCDRVELVGRETLQKTSRLTAAQLPAAMGTCTFGASTVELITYVRSTPQVKQFVDDRAKAACTGDPALGRIEGDKFAVLAGGTIAEQVQGVVGGTLAPTACGG